MPANRGCNAARNQSRRGCGDASRATRDVEDALNAAQLAIDEYYNGDREWAERWLLKAHEAGKGIEK
jgi:hypothetical protein